MNATRPIPEVVGSASDSANDAAPQRGLQALSDKPLDRAVEVIEGGISKGRGNPPAPGAVHQIQPKAPCRPRSLAFALSGSLGSDPSGRLLSLRHDAPEPPTAWLHDMLHLGSRAVA